METKGILKYLNYGQYCIVVPVYYECEEKPAWRKVFVGNQKECEDRFYDYPDYYKATNEENADMRKNRYQEYMFLKESGRRKADCKAIKLAYGF